MKKLIPLVFAFLLLAIGKSKAQSDFHALKQQFLNYREADKQDSALFIARKMNQLALEEETDTSYWYALSMRYQGNPHETWGNKDSVLHYWQKSVNLFKKYHSVSNDFVTGLNKLGTLYSEMGDYKSAEPYYKQALEIRKKALGEEHPDYASSLNNLGSLYSDMGDNKSAEPFYKQALEIRKKALGEEHPNYASSLFNLGSLYSDMGDYKSAEPYYKQALEIRKKALGEEHPDYASSLNSLGILYSDMGDYKSAERLYKEAIDILINIFGVAHSKVINLETKLAILLAGTGRESQGYYILSTNFIKKTTEISDNFEWLNGNQLDAYWRIEKDFYGQINKISNLVFERIPEAAGLSYNSALVSKSRLLEAKISNGIYSKEIDKLRIQLIGRRSYLNKLESDYTDDKDKIDKVRSEVDSLDKSLILCWPEYSRQKKNLSITWEQVEHGLDEFEAAIEFVRFYDSKDSSYYYNALILKKYDKMPTLVRLCKEVDLKPLIKQAKNDREILDKEMLIEYYSLIWQPLEASLDGIKVVYYSPVGKLNEVPFHAIQIPSSKSLQLISDTVKNTKPILDSIFSDGDEFPLILSDRYTLHQLTSTRYLAMGLKDKTKEPIGSNIVLIGGVNYNYIPGISNENNKIEKFEMAANRSSTYNPDTLPFLSATKVEVEEVSRQLTEAAWQTKLIEYDMATEESVKKLENKEVNGILHIATHGYAFPEYDYNDTTISKNSFRYSYRYNIDPMVRSGLILAGGNWAWIDSDTLSKLGAEENGILTALEVSQLNLKNTKLVVLSACKTGLGNIQGSEGTFGLKRGFKLAGVEQLIVSLWEVPDNETMELMTYFYSDLTKTLNPVISFDKAQKEMRIKYPADPKKWAGFVLVR